MSILVVILILFAVLGGGAILFDKLVLSKSRKRKGLFVRILLYEQIGDDKVFKGGFKGVEKKDEKLGSYIWIPKLKKAIDIPLNRDYFFDKEFDKALNVCKYSDDDYRVMARLRSNEFFRVEVVSRPKLDESGEPVFDVDEDGVKSPVFEEVEELIPYKEPLGITQEGREASRFNRVFTKRMQEKRGEKASFWDKYGNIISVAFLGMILLISFVYMSNNMKETNKVNAEMWGEKLDGAVKAVSNPSWVEGVLEKLNTQRLEENKPAS